MPTPCDIITLQIRGVELNLAKTKGKKRQLPEKNPLKKVLMRQQESKPQHKNRQKDRRTRHTTEVPFKECSKTMGPARNWPCRAHRRCTHSAWWYPRRRPSYPGGTGACECRFDGGREGCQVQRRVRGLLPRRWRGRRGGKW